MAKNVVLKIGLKGTKVATKGLKTVGSAVSFMGKAATVAGSGLAILSTKLAGDFQKSLLEVSTLMKNTSNRQLEIMSRELRSVSQSSGLALSSISKAKYDIVSAGFSNAAESAAILDASTRLAVGGVTTAASAADILTTSLNAMGKDARDVTQVSDILFTTVRLGKTTMTELGASLGQVLPFAKSMNLSLADVGASMATLTASGVNTTEATTALRAAIQALSAPSEGAKTAMAQAGIEVKKFEDGTVDLVSTIGQFEGMNPETITKFIPNVRAVLGIATMANNFDVLRDNVNQFSSESAGATEEAFAKMAKGFNTQMNMLKNSVQSVFIEIGNVIIDVIQPTLASVNKEFSRLGEIGFDNLGAAIKNQLPEILTTLQKAFIIAFDNIGDRIDLLGDKIADAVNPFSDKADFIAAKQEILDRKMKASTDLIGTMFSEMYLNITEEAETSARKQEFFNELMNEADLNRLQTMLDNLETELEAKKNFREQDSENEEIANEKKRKGISLLQLRQNDHNTKLDMWAKEHRERNVKEEAIEKHVKNQKILFMSQELSAATSQASSFLGLAKQASATNKRQARLTQTLAYAEAVMKALEASNKAFAFYGGWPGGVIPAAISLSFGLTQAGAIKSQKFAYGGIVQGNDTGAGDTVPAMLTPGELILNQAQQNNLAGNMGGLTINFNGPITNDEYVKDFIIPEIQRTISDNLA